MRVSGSIDKSFRLSQESPQNMLYLVVEILCSCFENHFLSFVGKTWITGGKRFDRDALSRTEITRARPAVC